MSAFRESLERTSSPLIASFARVPRVVAFLAVLALALLGIFVPGWGWVFLALVAVFLLWLLLLFWPRLTPPERLMRLAVIVLVLAITLTRAFPR